MVAGAEQAARGFQVPEATPSRAVYRRLPLRSSSTRDRDRWWPPLDRRTAATRSTTQRVHPSARHSRAPLHEHPGSSRDRERARSDLAVAQRSLITLPLTPSRKREGELSASLGS